MKSERYGIVHLSRGIRWRSQHPLAGLSRAAPTEDRCRPAHNRHTDAHDEAQRRPDHLHVARILICTALDANHREWKNTTWIRHRACLLSQSSNFRLITRGAGCREYMLQDKPDHGDAAVETW